MCVNIITTHELIQIKWVARSLLSYFGVFVELSRCLCLVVWVSLLSRCLCHIFQNKQTLGIIISSSEVSCWLVTWLVGNRSCDSRFIWFYLTVRWVWSWCKNSRNSLGSDRDIKGGGRCQKVRRHAIPFFSPPLSFPPTVRGSAVSSFSGVWGGVPAVNAFKSILGQNLSWRAARDFTSLRSEMLRFQPVIITVKSVSCLVCHVMQ